MKISCENCFHYDEKYQYCLYWGETVSWDFICDDCVEEVKSEI